MSNDNNAGSVFWVFVIVGVAAAAVIGAMSPQSGTSTSSSPSRDSSFERRYTEQRFKQEGYSSKDAATAADAVLKFQRAQEARRNK